MTVTRKPNKFDIKMRYVKTQAVEIDCPAAKEKSAIFGGRVGEYTTTHEVFMPGALVREMERLFKNPKSTGILTDALKQIATAVMPLVSQSPTAAGVVAGAAEVMGNMAGSAARAGARMGSKLGNLAEEMYPPSPFARPMSTATPSPIDPVRFQEMMGEADEVPRPVEVPPLRKPRKSRKEQPQE